MRIACFSNQFAADAGHGISRYSRELIGALNALDETDRVIPVSAWSNMAPEKLADVKRDSDLVLLPWGRRITPLAWTLFDAPKLEGWLADPIDIVHALSLGYPLATRKPFVVTIHDLGPLTHRSYFTAKGNWLMARSLEQARNHASALICVSHSTAGEVMEYCGTGVEDRIHVVPEGVSGMFLRPGAITNHPVIRELERQDRPFFLTTGQISPRKNTGRVIEALASVADRIPHHLVCVGGEGWNTDLVRETARQSGIADRLHFLGYVPDEDLLSLYRSASAFVHVSLYEGFGLPILEAMASNCPVITSNVSSMPEVAGNAAILVDPLDTEAIASAMEKIESDPDCVQMLIDRGKGQIQKFSWQQCAKDVRLVYQAVM